jgi:hypothetical protein
LCGLTLNERLTNVELRKRFGIENAVDVIGRNRLRCFAHVERKPEDNWVKQCIMLEGGGNHSRGRPKKTRLDMIRMGFRKMALRKEDVNDILLWRWTTSGRREVNPGDQ